MSTNNKSRQVWHFIGICMMLAGMLGMLAGLQIIVCRRDHPGRPTLECLKR